MKTNKKISPCPICNHKNFDLYDGFDEKNELWKISHIYCKDCHYRLEDATKTLLELIDIHNNRTTIYPTCEGDSIVADIAFAKIRRLEDRLIELGELDHAPCFICGYNGQEYFNSKTHNCMSRKNNEGYMKNMSSYNGYLLQWLFVTMFRFFKFY